MSGSRSGLVAVLAGVVVAGVVSAPPVAGTATAVIGPAPQVVVSGSAVPVSIVVPLAKRRPTVAFTSTTQLVVDVDPDLKGKRNWKLKLQRKSGSKWKKIGIYRTKGTSEVRRFSVKAGAYRVKVYARAGYRSITTTAYRFDPAPPIPVPGPPPPTPDTTAPGVVTGLAVVDRTATSINLTWVNPADPDLAAVIVRRAVGGTAPATPADGVGVGLPAATAAGVTDTGLAVATGYAYAVFTRDASGNTSPGVALATTTLAPAVVSTTRVSVRSDGSQATGSSYSPAMSGDGRWIAYYSSAADLVTGDTNTSADVFLFDRDTGATRRVSLSSGGAQATGDCYEPAISADGRWITYYSGAADLVPGDTNTAYDVFLFDRDTGATRRISVRTDGSQATGFSYAPAISGDGRWITYTSFAADLVDGDTNGVDDVFLFDRDTGATRRVSVRTDGTQATSGNSYDPAISADGRWITYYSDATDLASGDTNTASDVFLFDRDTGSTRRVSVRSDGSQATGASYDPAISADGRWITYWSNAADLIDGDTNGRSDVFLFDRDTATTRRVSVRTDGTQTADNSVAPAISADGRWITYYSHAADLVAGDTNGTSDIFLHDRDTGTTQRVSVRSDGTQATGGDSYAPAISADGRWITYQSSATDLVTGDTNAAGDVFLTRMW